MLLPKGKLIKIYRCGTPREFLKESITGFVQFSWKDGNELYIGTVVLLKGKPILASVEMVKSKREIKGEKALQIIAERENAAIEVYTLSQHELELTLKTNVDAAITTPEKESTTRTPKSHSRHQQPRPQRAKILKPVVSGLEENLNRYLSTIGTFTGVIQAEGVNRQATVIVKNGKIVGAEVTYDKEVLRGNLALQFLDFYGKISAYEGNVDDLLSENPEVRILNREELMRKYNIKPPSEDEIERIIANTFGDDTYEDETKTDTAKKHISKILESSKENVMGLLGNVLKKRLPRR